MVTPLYGKVHPGDFILSENDQIGALSRDNLTFESGLTFKPGEVAAIKTSNGCVVKLNPAGSDGSEVAAVIPVYAYDTTAAAVMGVAITRNAAVKEDGLIWPAGISAPNKAASIVQLADRGIIIRPRSYVG